jgi:hypothetical protein
MVAGNPVYGGKMITNKVEEPAGIFLIVEGNNIASQYENIPDGLQGVSGKKFLIFRKFEMEIRTVLNMHRQWI